MNFRRIAAGVGAVAVATAGVALLDTTASSAAGTTVVSTAAVPGGWHSVDTRTSNNEGSVVGFTYGPTDANGVSATGNGSLLLKTPTNAAKADYYQSTSTPLGSATGIGYRLDAANTGPQASFQLRISGATRQDGDASGFTTLVFEPYMQPGQGAFVNGDNTWHTYSNLENGYWWSTKAVAVSGGGFSQGQSVPLPLSRYISANPGATVFEYGVNLGSYNAGGVANIDDVSFAGTTTNFEVDKVATTLDAESMVIATVLKPNGNTLITHLTTVDGLPLAGKSIVNTAGPYTLCTAVTDSTGTAKCKAPNGGLAVILFGGYNASYAGDLVTAAATAHGGLIG